MRRLPPLILACFAALLSACGPTFNWREAAIDDTVLIALFPCEPGCR